MITKLLEYAKRYDMLPGKGVVLACVSGGADSMALLTALLELAPVCSFSVEVAHFDHKLRGAESDRDREFVTEHCKRLAIPCHVGSGDTRAYAKAHKLGIEESAREMRYKFFRETTDKTGAHRIATAHNSDDNAETVLLSLARGAGSRGLSGIPPRRGDIIRPLLCVSRGEIEAFLDARVVPFIVDSTNMSDKYARNKIRRHVSPVLQSVNSSYSQHVLESGELLRRDDEYLFSLAADFLAIHGGYALVSQLAALPEAISSRVVLLLAGGSLPFSHVRRVLGMCGTGYGSKTIETQRGVFIREYDRLGFYASAEVETFSAVEITPGTDTELPELGFVVRCREVDYGALTDGFYGMCQKNDNTVNKSFIYFLFKKDAICGRIIVRPRLEGDNINILGRGVSKSLKKLFIENKTPKRDRGLVPVIADDNGPLAVYGMCQDARAAPEKETPIIEISFVRIVDE